jgi:hypothetical protein
MLTENGDLISDLNNAQSGLPQAHFSLIGHYAAGHYPTSLHIIFLFQIFIILKIFTMSLYFPVFSFSFTKKIISYKLSSLIAYHMWVALEYIGGIVEIYKQY